MYPEAMKATFQIENPTYHSKVRPALHLGSIISFLLVYQCDCNSLCCVIPENNPSPPQKGWEIPCGTGVSKTEKKKENKIKENNVWRKIGISTGEVGSQSKPLIWAELHTLSWFRGRGPTSKRRYLLTFKFLKDTSWSSLNFYFVQLG